MRVSVPQLAWHEPSPFHLEFPDDWEVCVREMGGYRRPALSGEQLREAVQNPVGIPPIRELARGHKEVAILFDDLTRPTRCGPLARPILEELAEAGIGDKHIRFVMALGTHGVASRIDFEKKLGRDILRRFPVYNHDPFVPGVYVGTTSTFRTPVYLNEEVSRCDLRIGIGSVVSHAWAGFGGGGKIILPGVCSTDTIVHNHRAYHLEAAAGRRPARVGLGIWEENPMRHDIDEAAEIAGLEVLANAVVNGWGETCALYVGSLKEAFSAAARDASASCLAERAVGMDVVVSNTFGKVIEGFLGLPTAYESVREDGGDVVLIANSPEGQVIHYLSGPFGEFFTGPEWKDAALIPGNVERLIVFSEYPDVASRRWYSRSPKVHFCETWAAVSGLLRERHGPRTRAVVYPSADIHYFAERDMDTSSGTKA